MYYIAHDQKVFPAQAGVILYVVRGMHDLYGIPRASGGDPAWVPKNADGVKYSPRKRG